MTTLRTVLRGLRRRPGWTAGIVLTLALAIGANTALFSVLDAVLLRALPYAAPERLITIEETSPGFPEMAVSYLDGVDWRARVRSLTEVAMYRGVDVNLGGAENPERVPAVQVSDNLFRALGRPPAVGRGFEPAEDAPGGAPVVVLSDALARRRFGSPAAAVGQTLRVDAVPRTVVGVMGREFRLETRPEVFLPLGPAMVGRVGNRGNHPSILAVGRLAPGVSFAEARAELESVGRALDAEYPATNKAVLPRPRPMQARLTEDVAGGLWLLQGAVGLVLLIAAANVGSLVLARGSSRARELAIRAAIGAGQRRLVGQLLLEAALLGLGGGVAGLGVAAVAIRLLAAHRPVSLPDWVDLTLEPRVLLFTLLVSLGSVLVFGLVPALLASRTQLHDAMRAGDPRMSGGQHRLRAALVVFEVALALVLLVGAGLATRAVARLLRADAGFEPAHVLTFRLSIPEVRRPDGPALDAFRQDLLRELRALPGVVDASVSTLVPVDGPWEGSFWRDGEPEPSVDQRAYGAFGYVTSGYARTFGLRLVEGRWLEPSDGAAGRRVVVVDERLARDVFGGRALGRGIVRGEEKQLFEIVGVVRHVSAYGLVGPERARGQFYLPFEQVRNATPGQRSVYVALRAAGSPEALGRAAAEAVKRVDPELPVYQVRTMEQVLAESVEAQRFAALQLGLFALLALVLAVIGLYAVLSYSVAQRTQEIGIRMALGASPRQVLRQVTGQGVRWAALGLAIGLVGAVFGAGVLRGAVPGVEPGDPLLFAAAVAGLLALSGMAAWIPARRAVRVEPTVALRAE